jgi:hypothetical protein
MAHFTDCDGGWINLDHVVKVGYQRCADPAMLFYGAGDVLIGKKTHHSGFDPEELTSPVVAAAGVTAIVIAVYGEGHDDRPTETIVETLPIVAWRIAYGCAIPILPDTSASNSRVLVQLPDGKLLLADDCTFDSVADAERALLLQYQADWDRRHHGKRPVKATT